MNLSSQQVHVARPKPMPTIRFSREKKLTSYAGLILFQAVFARLDLPSQLSNALSHLGRSVYQPGTLMMLLVVHLLLGFRRLRGIDYYRDDPLVCQVLGLKRLPDVGTVSRRLKALDKESIGQFPVSGTSSSQYSRVPTPLRELEVDAVIDWKIDRLS